MGVPSLFGKCRVAKDLARRWCQSRVSSQARSMWQKQTSKLNSISTLLGKICAFSYLSLCLILQATYEQIIFIQSNISLKLVEVANAQKVCRDTSLYKQREEKTVQTQSQCHWSWCQFITSFSRTRLSAQGGAGPFAVCAIHISKQKDCFSQTIVAWNKWAQARRSTNSLLCSLFYEAE